MKKILSIILVICMCIAMTACSGESTSTNDTSVTEGNTQETSSADEKEENVKVAPKIYDYVYTIGIRNNGTVIRSGEYDQELAEWSAIKDIAFIDLGCLGLKTDGTVVATNNTKEEVKEGISKWSDIVDITSATDPIGLKADGTIEVFPTTPHAEEFKTWSDIVAIDCAFVTVLGLKADGTCVASKSGAFEVGQGNVSGWTDLIAVAAGVAHSVGLKNDGTVVAVGDNRHGECNVSGWSDIVAIRAYNGATVGLKSDGTVVSCGDDATYNLSEVATWTDIAEIAIGADFVIGMKNDGTIVSTDDSADFSNWDLIL